MQHRNLELNAPHVMRFSKQVSLGSTVFADDGYLVIVEVAEAVSNDGLRSLIHLM